MKAVDIAGKRFGRLVAIEPTKARNHNSVVWKCKCDCGRYANISCRGLISGHANSCGCLFREQSRKRLTETADKMKEKRKVHDGTSDCLLTDTVRVDSCTGVRGVSFSKSNSKYVAYINYKKKRYIIGYFYTIDDAKEARKIAEKEIWGKDLE